MSRVLLHVCCGPCSVGVVPSLRERGLEPVGWFGNPNIHPTLEWLARLESAGRFARLVGMALAIEPDPDWRGFIAEVGSLDPPERCARCFAIRLDSAAREAEARGIPRFTTTLLASPWQDRDLLCEAGMRAAERRGVEFLAEDFRGGFREGKQRARELGLYLQTYCGCVFSEAERYRGRVARERAKWEPGDPPT